MLHSNAFNSTRDTNKRLTGFRQQGPLTYLPCPLFVGRPRNIFFYDVVNKIVCSYGGRAVLTNHVLQTFPNHFLSVVTPLSFVLIQIQMLVVGFLGIEK